LLPVEPVHTARLELAPLEAGDADRMVGVLADPTLYSFTDEAPPDLATLRERYARQVAGCSGDGSEQWLNWIARLRDTGEAVGFAQATVTVSGNHADVAWLIGLPWQGQGFASEAASAVVRWLLDAGVQTVEAHIHPGHVASQAVARRAGLVATGIIDRDGEEVWRATRSPTSSPARSS
jgi:RimJ/RimL family protein N-acetyltransferase